MLARQCDNDRCTWVSYTNEDGITRVRWQHVPECEPDPDDYDDDSSAYQYV